MMDELFEVPPGVPRWLRMLAPLDVLIDPPGGKDPAKKGAPPPKAEALRFSRLADEAMRRGDHHSARIYRRQADGC